jgi:hypothetical protein
MPWPNMMEVRLYLAVVATRMAVMTMTMVATPVMELLVMFDHHRSI